MNEHKILLIDDDHEDYLLIKDLLSDVRTSRYNTTWESSYEAGLKALAEQDFDACLLDYKLGAKTGLELLEECRKQNPSLRTPVIILTGLGDLEIDLKAMRQGVADYVVKDQLTAPLLERSIRYSIKQSQDLEELKQVRAQVLLQDRLASLGLLASSLAHEIGTPMGIIRSRAELAEKRCADNPSLKKDMGIIITQIDRVTKLVHSLLHLARGEKSDFTTLVSLDAVIQDVLNLLEHEFGRKQIALTKKIEPGIEVLAEPGPLGQVLLNLLVNSIHAIEKAKKTRPNENFGVVLSAKKTNGKVSIAIQDNGSGISEAEKLQLFKPFFTTKEIGHGTGLGLATAYKIVNSWRGSIEVQSEAGVGSTFTVLIPSKSP